MSKNSNLHKAMKVKNDEFYTQLTDIEKELKHYKQHLKDKIIYCNCDDPKMSKFYEYFKLNFSHLKLKKLITTHYAASGNSYKTETYDNNTTEITNLSGNGDFRSDECIKILKESDIVITNPPFSLFREFIAQLIQYDKKFLVIGNMNALKYKDIFPLIKNNKMWLGVNSKAMPFLTPQNEIKSVYATWYTNLQHKNRNERLILCKTYKGNESDYPKYDNYNAIEINKVCNIPIDYDGEMGVPISFLSKHNPEQFEILGESRYITGKCYSIHFVNGKELYHRLIIKHKR